MELASVKLTSGLLKTIEKFGGGIRIDLFKDIRQGPPWQLGQPSKKAL